MGDGKMGKAPGPAPARAKVQLAPSKADQHVNVRCLGEWKDWAHGLAKHRRSDLGQLIDRLLTEEAARHGYRPPPDRT